MRFLHSTLLCLLLIPASVQGADPSKVDRSAIAVLDFELNDLTLDPGNPAERERTASIKPLLRDLLAAKSHTMVEVSAAAQNAADRGVGYLFDHSDVAAALGRTVGADWVIVGRVHKPSFLFVYFKAHVVNVRSGELTADLVVEVKGPQQALTQRGVQRLADQIEAAIGH